ncbi:1-phosphofructokinase family hexose kinase [Maribacter cobaltidurans]|uniref:1-phosphofructokinase n=1 Tax=Maribacter cobaltidurans TaxID=1178778 RepID=A0A223V1S8_9FLAO|nr:PfkB family carbohydrate kinase [Maribacter cobaltidurans]ASV29196.1 1-phosphofructokinase [Maribacter cobaltidurans]GGD71114.1 tagatose-6-phosphate kinase [Maribacter cobaltidurans]
MVLTVCPNPSIDTYAWLDSFKIGQVNRIIELEEFPGGKGIHVAMALKELGVPVSLLGNWAGPNGHWIKKTYPLRGIEIGGPQLRGSTRKCYTFRSELDNDLNNTELLEPGPKMSNKDWDLFQVQFRKALSHCTLVCLSGSWPSGAPDDAYAQLLKICNKENKKAILDCSGVQLENALKVKFYGLHINEQEAVSNFGVENHLEIRKYLKKNVPMLAITKGKEGLFLYLHDQYVHANVKVEDVKSTVGSGDCLTAGIAFATFNNMPINQVATYGVACGAANCMNEDLGMLRIKDVQSLLPLVEINKN